VTDREIICIAIGVLICGLIDLAWAGLTEQR
jgi:hypothetical protein